MVVADNQRIETLIERVLRRLGTGPTSFYDLLVELDEVEYRDILLAWGRIRERISLERDEWGRYLLPAGRKATAPGEASPPLSVDRM